MKSAAVEAMAAVELASGDSDRLHFALFSLSIGLTGVCFGQLSRFGSRQPVVKPSS